MTFASLGLIDPLLRALEALGYHVPTAIQARSIPVILAGRDLLASAQTGTGKTAAFALPLLQGLAALSGARPPGAPGVLVLVPTRELAEQVAQSVRGYARHLPLRIGVVYGGVPVEPQLAWLARGVDLLVATPGRLLDLQRQGALEFSRLDCLVLDEADRMLDLGFAEDLRWLVSKLPARRQTLLFSATFSDPLRQLAGQFLQDPASIDSGPRNVAAGAVSQQLIVVDKRRKGELFLHLLGARRWRQVLVFVRTRKGVEALCQVLREAGVEADGIHGDKAQGGRLRALERFRAGQLRVLVATDVAARGLDIDDLPLVVNFDLPQVAEDYVHRIGRTGRAGKAGQALSLVCADEAGQLAAIEALLRQTLRRDEEPGFSPEHRMPRQAPRKPASSAGAAAKPQPEAPPKPQVRAVRQMPSFAGASKKKP